MSKIVFIGTSSGMPAKDRHCSSFIVQTGQTIFQFDAGEGVARGVREFKVKYNEIENWSKFSN